MASSFGVESLRPAPAIAHGDAVLVGIQPRTLSEGLARGVALFPDGGFVFTGVTGGVASATYVQVFARAQRILGGLRREGVKPGDKLVLYFRECVDFVPALWAALLAGAGPLPLMRSEWNRRHAVGAPQVFRHLRHVLDAPRVVTDSLEREQGAALGLKFSDVVPLAALEGSDADAAFFKGSLDEPSLLILSSGTTATPNLVTLSARALINRWWPAMPDPEHAATFLSWSPFDHVMGLGLVSPNLRTKVHLPTSAFVQSPALWLSALDQFRVTHCTMTNFAMSLVERAASAGTATGQSWDLSSVRKIGVGAEMVSPEVCRRFIAALQPFGLRSDAIILGYGLSECGPVVGGDNPFSASEDRELTPFALLDRPTRGHSVRIVNADGKIVVEGDVGAVEVNGPTMALGYYGDEPGTRALFTADGWIRTGDLGRLDAGRLTITGREKEIIVIRAKKFACVEIEAIARSVAGVTAAFAVACKARARDGRHAGGAFALFFVAPSVAPSDLGALARRLQTKIAGEFGQAPAYLVPIAEDDIPRTPTGKVQRLQLAESLEAGAFDAAHAALKPLIKGPAGAEPVSPSERRVASIWEEILGVEDCSADDDFFELGGDSLAAENLVLALEQAFGKRIPPDLLHRDTTIRGLAAFLDGRPAAAPAPAGRPAPTSGSEGNLDPEIENKLRAFTAGWPGEQVAPGSLLFGMNRAGSRRPLFWCFQYPGEFWQLATGFGPDQPVYGMRSGHLAMDYTPANVAALARRYTEEILSVDPTGPYLIGGVCQGGIVAVAIARQLQRWQRRVLLLTVLDARFWELFQPDPYTGKVLFFAGVRSHFNPYRRFRHPEKGWRKLFSGGLRLELLSAGYGQFFDNAVVADMAQKFQSALTWAATEDGTAKGHAASGALPDSAYKAKFRTPARLTMHAGEAGAIAITVTNDGTATWGPSRESGIFVGNHWLTTRGELVVWADGRAPFHSSLHPGESVTLALPVRAPGQPGDYLVEIDLVEEGVTWFKDKRANTIFLEMSVSLPTSTASTISSPQTRTPLRKKR